jgi:hypothetical protein
MMGKRYFRYLPIWHKGEDDNGQCCCRFHVALVKCMLSPVTVS